ncbi:MAG: hypothetical protein ACWIPI_10640 [Polaribacter sp.]
MKKHILFLILLPLVLSCDRKKSTINRVPINVEVPVKTYPKNDTIFLGYRVSMSLKEFNDHTNKLLEDKKIQKKRQIVML